MWIRIKEIPESERDQYAELKYKFDIYISHDEVKTKIIETLRYN